VAVASELKSSHSFGTSNSFNSSGKYVLVAFFGHFSQTRDKWIRGNKKSIKNIFIR
jgi:hypothetical protein